MSYTPCDESIENHRLRTLRTLLQYIPHILPRVTHRQIERAHKSAMSYTPCDESIGNHRLRHRLRTLRTLLQYITHIITYLPHLTYRRICSVYALHTQKKRLKRKKTSTCLLYTPNEKEG